MDWTKELEASLADHPQLLRKKSRQTDGLGFFAGAKELGYLREGEFHVRLGASGIFALREQVNHPSVKSVGKEWIAVRPLTQADLEFALSLVEQALKERKHGKPRPKGKVTRAAKGKKRLGAASAFEDARALKALKEGCFSR